MGTRQAVEPSRRNMYSNFFRKKLREERFQQENQLLERLDRTMLPWV
jgi:hypothetical protein